MEYHLVLSLLSVLVPCNANTDTDIDWYAEVLGQTKFTLLQRNIALHDKESDDGKSKTFHPNPIDREQISLWKDGDVPFMFSVYYTGVQKYKEDFSDKEKDVIRRALKHISDNVPCIKFREVTMSTSGNKLIFSTNGDDNIYPPTICRAYLGMVGSVGGQASGSTGQTVHIHPDCFSFQTVVRLALISLGVADKLEENETKSDTQVNLAGMLALAQLYEEQTLKKSCFKQGNIPQYFNLLLKETTDLKKSCHKDSYYLYLSDTHILQLPSFTKARCTIEPYPVTNYYGLSGAVSAIIDGKLHVCGGGGAGGVASCHGLHGTAWHGTPNLSLARQNAGSSLWQGGWLVTGGSDSNTLHPSSELYNNGGWTAGPSMEEKTFWSRKPLMGIAGHCQITAGGRVIVAGGSTLPHKSSTGATFSWDGSSWSELGSMKTAREHHACVERDGVVFAIGGGVYDKLKSVEKLNLATGVWNEGPELPYEVSYVQAVNIHGDIFVVGGEGSGGKIIKLVDNTWETVSDYGFDGTGLFSNPPIVSSDQVVCQ